MRPTEERDIPQETDPALAPRGSGPHTTATIRALPGTRWGWGLLVALGYVVATVVMTWPYAARLGTSTPLGEDPLLQVWVARWVQHALVTNPLHLYDANVFYPHENSLAYSDSNVPAALLAAPVYLLTGNALAANNLLVLGTFILGAGGVYALVTHLTGNRAAGFLAGLAYAFLPYRFDHIWHLNQLSHAWTPWVVLALVLLLRRQSWSLAVGFGVLLAVQAVSSFYVAFQIACAVGIVLVVAAVADPRVRSWRFLGRLALAGAVAAVLILPLALPYFAVREQQGLERTLAEAGQRGWVATPGSYLKVSERNPLWHRLNPARGGEDTLFPGGLALVGALAALAGYRRRPAVTTALVLIAAVAFVLSLGPTWRADRGGTTPLPYRFLYDHFSFFRAMRVPARFGVLADFAIVALAGLGVAWAWERLAPRLPVAQRAVTGAALTGCLALLVLAELNAGPAPLQTIDRRPEVAAPYAWLARQPHGEPVLELPGASPMDAALAMYWSTYHWQPLVQGYSGFAPRAYGDFLAHYNGDLKRPDGTVAQRVSQVTADNVGVLQQLGVRYVLLHRPGYKREDLPTVIAQLEGTGVVEKVGDFGEAMIYRLAESPEPPLPLDVALFAPSLALPGSFWEPALVARNPTTRLALLYVKHPLRLTTTWRDERGRQVRRDTLSIALPSILPRGELFCTVRLCPAASGASAPPDEGRGPALRLAPTTPGRYSVQLDLTGDVTASRTFDVEVAAEPPAEADGPPLAFAGAALGTDQLQRGMPVPLTLDWEVRGRAPEDYILFAQLIGPDGKVWGQYDAPAGWTSHYSSAWQPGERLSLPWTVPLAPDAPPGSYRLLVGMYRRGAAGPERIVLRYPSGDASEYIVGELEVR